MNLAEYRQTSTRLADFLPWAALAGEGSFSTRTAASNAPLGFAVPTSTLRCRPNSSPWPAG